MATQRTPFENHFLIYQEKISTTKKPCLLYFAILPGLALKYLVYHRNSSPTCRHPSYDTKDVWGLPQAWFSSIPLKLNWFQLSVSNTFSSWSHCLFHHLHIHPLTQHQEGKGVERREETFPLLPLFIVMVHYTLSFLCRICSLPPAFLLWFNISWKVLEWIMLHISTHRSSLYSYYHIPCLHLILTA